MPSAPLAAAAGTPRRRLSAAAAIALVVLAFVCTALLVRVWTMPGRLTRGVVAESMDTDMQFVSHAGAGMASAIYSNSRQALDAAAARGMHRVEMDFMITRDGRIVATHGWGRRYLELRPGLSWLPARLWFLAPPPVPSHEAFMARSMRGGLTPVDAAYLAAWLERHPSVRLVTDTLGDNIELLRMFAAIRNFPVEQLVPQIYGRDEWPAVRKLGYTHVIYTLYKDRKVPIGSVLSFAGRTGVTVTMPLYRASEATLGAFRQAGVPVFVHTIDDPQRAAQLRRWGASGVYTNRLYSAGPVSRR